MIESAALLYAVTIVGVVAFQCALIAGAPWGRLTQGGRHEGPLPKNARIAAAISILLLTSMAAAIASAAGMPPGWPAWTAVLALAVQALSTLLNWITPSLPERRLWGPVTTLMLLLAAFVVLAA